MGSSLSLVRNRRVFAGFDADDTHGSVRLVASQLQIEGIDPGLLKVYSQKSGNPPQSLLA
jgi:hypothetical protein